VSAPTLFDFDEAPLPVRSTDVATARVAAKSVDVAARKAEVLDAMRLIGVSCTASEILGVLRQYGSRMDIGSVRSRLNQLRRDDGLVRPQGVKTVPKPQGSGRPEQTWVLT
jgi:hypothetical protein